MAFSQNVINDAWKRAGGKCECTRQCTSHAGYRCGKVLDPNNSKPEQQWHAHHRVSLDADGLDTLENCQILCIDCHQNTESYGG